jgi:hypothetical protein
MEANVQVDGRRLKDAVRAFEREYIMLRLKENRFDNYTLPFRRSTGSSPSSILESWSNPK